MTIDIYPGLEAGRKRRELEAKIRAEIRKKEEEEGREYLRLFDSLARFYNSQSTAHVGYLLTVSAFVAGTFLALFTQVLIYPGVYFDPIFNILLRAVMWVLLFVIPPWYFYGFFPRVGPIPGLGRFLPNLPLSFKYLWGRTQLYVALSHIVWDHMELTTPRKQVIHSHPYAHALRERAIRLGIQNAVSSLFEARLFVSRCLEKGIKFHDIRIRENLKHFDIKPDESATVLWLGEGTPYYAVPTCGRIFRLVDCLYLSWESQMAPYFDPEQKNETLKRRGMLLKSPREALAVEDCLSLWPPR